MASQLKGVFAPVVTPFGEDGSPDADRLLAHCRWLLSHECGLAVFGTNSEGNSLAVEEKLDLIDALIEGGVPAGRMMPGTGSCALPDAVKMCSHVARRGCGGALILPPFYYKDASDEGLYAFFADLIERVGDDRLRLYLYHIPPIAGVGFSLDLTGRLIEAYPEIVVGMKDSSRDDDNTRALLERFPGWGVFPGNEMNLVEFVRAGAVGTISATCNVNAPAIVDLYQNVDAADANDRLAKVNELRKALASYPMIPAMKALIAAANDDPVWRNVRAPLLPLGEEDAARLKRDVSAIGFELRTEPAAAMAG